MPTPNLFRDNVFYAHAISENHINQSLGGPDRVAPGIRDAFLIDVYSRMIVGWPTKICKHAELLKRLLIFQNHLRLQ